MLSTIRTSRLLLATLLLTAPLGACDALLGKEIARLPVNQISTPQQEVAKEATVKLQKNDKVAIWSEMDMEYQGEAPLRFQVVVLKNGRPFHQLELDPTQKNVSMNEVKTDVNGSISWSFSGKNTELTIQENADYTFKARLIAAPNPTLQLRKAELVLKK
ncbi:hypothetical protein ACFPAF_07410 [Hymenobacter endophyticus]|uniref:Uncharacterized protein n=1 Tax=Hymenobacter endophyticus TaxID=3076335 RepID=A0ABU3TFT2_9BACT|nr:hypothetical protein [Hymenobacter endophyticus]MDU0370212.1 hypothetical protein [Hymenobacter endophyticus]